MVSSDLSLLVMNAVRVVLQDHAYPADELMPLTCKGRVRGLDRGRGDIDEALGK